MVVLRYMEKKDIETVLSWQEGHTEEDLYQWAGPGYSYPLTKAQIQGRLETSSINTLGARHFIYVIELMPEEEVIGQIELAIKAPESSSASIGKFLIGASSRRGQGYGRQALMCLVDQAFNQLNVEQLFLKVFDFNQQAIRCYEQCGFAIVKKEERVYKGLEGYWNRYYMLKENK